MALATSVNDDFHEWFKDCMLKRKKGENIIKSKCKSLISNAVNYSSFFSENLPCIKTFPNVPSHEQNKKQVIYNLEIGCQAFEISSAVVLWSKAF